jgi:hypothetical protein
MECKYESHSTTRIHNQKVVFKGNNQVVDFCPTPNQDVSRDD